VASSAQCTVLEHGERPPAGDGELGQEAAKERVLLGRAGKLRRQTKVQQRFSDRKPLVPRG
jgi:hypothetical protein